MIKVANVVVYEKFIDNLIECQDNFINGWTHDYFQIDRTSKSNYVMKHKNRIQNIKKEEFLRIINSGEYDALFIHSFIVISPDTIISIIKSVKVFWFAWGADIYNYPKKKPFIKLKLYHQQTEKYLVKIEKEKEGKISLQTRIRRNLRWIKYLFSETPEQKQRKEIEMAVNRIDFFSGVLKYEYDLMKGNKFFRAERVNFRYRSPLSASQLQRKLTNENKKNILLGNSAAYTNNHLDILEHLHNKCDMGNHEIIIPLSYANNDKEYVMLVKKKAQEYFGGRVNVLLNYIPSDDYFRLLDNCGVAIFFHERQNAMGNIIFSICNGAKVFLSETCGVFSFMKSLGIKIFSVQSDLTTEEINKPLTQEEAMENRKILNTYYSDSNYINDQKNILNCIKYYLA